MSSPEKNVPTTDGSHKRTLGEGVFRLCAGCAERFAVEELTAAFEVCPRCGHHHRLDLSSWLRLICDEGLIERWDSELVPADPLQFRDDRSYGERVAQAQKKSGTPEAVEVGTARIGQVPVALGAFVFSFMGGSMGSVVGEKITRLFERATERRLPVVLLQASGGARMQEGILSLMQMAKCVAALDRLREAEIPFISCLLHPTTGGVAASFAFLGDVNIGEAGALIGFAGPRVIESTIGAKLPPGFQRAEFLLDHGMLDIVCSRLEMKATIRRVLGHLWSGEGGMSGHGHGDA